MQKPEFIFCNGILATPEKISMIEGQSEVITIYKKDIQHISLEHGYQSERPIVQIVFGVVVLMISMYPILKLMAAFLSDIKVHILAFLMLALIPIGVWAIRSALKRGYYLDVQLENDRRKLGFQTGWDKTGMTEFFKQIAPFGYIVDASLIQEEIKPDIKKTERKAKRTTHE